MLSEILISKFKSRTVYNSRPRNLYSRRRYYDSIPLFGIVILLVGLLGLINASPCFAAKTVTSLEIATPELSDTISPNTTAYLNSEVVYSAENVENYAIQISYAENSIGLKLENGTTVISDTAADITGALVKNTWGYAWGDIDSSDTDLAYQPMSAYGNAKTIEQGTSDITSATKKIVFAAHLGDDIPTGHYRTNVLLSLVATPKATLTISGIAKMQEVTHAVCQESSENETAFFRRYA